MTTTSSNEALLKELCRQRLSSSRLILVSNRGPIEYHSAEDGMLEPHRGSGGVVTALSGISDFIEMEWIASAMGEGDREALRRANGSSFKSSEGAGNLYLQFVASPRSMYHKYYSVFCNPLLWFLQHYMWNSPRTPNIDRVTYDAWEKGYIPVNEAFAQAVVKSAKESRLKPIVLLNDYHLYLTPGYIRREMPELPIQHFIHIPWPSARYWQLLPDHMRQAIIRSLCSADIIGLQTLRDVNSFLNCCEALIQGAQVDYAERAVRLDGHVSRVRTYPISINVAGLRKLVSSPEVREYESKLRPLCGEKTIVRIDRAEPSKNIVRGFRAFDVLLGCYPELLGKVKFIAFLVPTRTHIRQYQRYIEEVKQLVKDMNDKYRTDDWYPIDYFYENNYYQALAGMRIYDVLLINAVIDGMNLVAKEGPIVNDRGGVLVLSETVGACEQLGENALTVSPADIEGTARALHKALTLPAEERERRARALKDSIAREDITAWLTHLLEDIASLV